MNKLICLIRRQMVAATPEERLRQQVLAYMLKNGYPKSLIAVEVPLAQLHTTSPLPVRRVDIICYNKASCGSLKPLLLIECKSVKITHQMILQLTGYNHFLRTPYIVLASPFQTILGRFDSQTSQYEMSNGFPKYSEIITVQK